MNFWTSRSPNVIFTQRLICNKLILGEGEREKEIVGTLTLMGELKKRVGAKSEVLREFKSEGERIEALSEEFGITLSDIEKEAIKNTANEIR